MATKNSQKTEKRSIVGSIKRDNQMAARRSVIEELFNDLYKDRHNIYIMNFFRGIFFGLGSALGGTVVLAIVVWILSFFIQVPGVGQVVKDAGSEIRTEQRQ